MEMQYSNHQPAQHRTSFDDSLNRIDTQRFTQWPNFTVEHEYGNDNRPRSAGAESTAHLFQPTRSPLQQNSTFFQRIKLMFTRFPVRDMSWLVGVTFTFGSAAFVINGFFLILPTLAPSTVFSTEVPYATPASSVVGGVIFLIGGWVGVLEALNLERGVELTVTEGVALKVISPRIRKLNESDDSVPEKEEPIIGLAVTTTNLSHHSVPTIVPSTKPQTQPAVLGSPNFIHWPSTIELRTRYLHDITYLGAMIQFIGTIVFAVAVLTSVPGVIDFTNIPLFYGTNLFPASLGGVLFLAASMIQILNAQQKWYRPELGAWEWHVGFWNAIGSLGFLLAGLFPFAGTTEMAFMGLIADFWGSWAFLIGSLIQWWGVMGYY